MREQTNPIPVVATTPVPAGAAAGRTARIASMTAGCLVWAACAGCLNVRAVDPPGGNAGPPATPEQNAWWRNEADRLNAEADRLERENADLRREKERLKRLKDD